MSLSDYRDILLTRLFGPNPNTTQILTALGLGAVAATTLPELANLAAWARLYIFSSSKLWRYQHAPVSRPTDQSLNSQAWAFVTGATDGIGYGFVCEFASRNMNVILHGRNPEKLSRIINELKSKHPRLHFEPFVCDATDRASWHKSFAELIPNLKRRKINLTILVNNIGGNPAPLRSFANLQDWTPSEVNAIVDMNVAFPTQVNRALLPILIENKPSCILNISSITGQNPMPWLSPYSACKAYGNQFSKALRMEMQAENLADPEEGIEVLNIVVGIVKSAAMKTETSFFVPSSQEMAKNVLQRVGCGEAEVFGYWRHSLQNYLNGCLADGMRDYFTIKSIRKLKEQYEEEAKKQK